MPVEANMAKAKRPKSKGKVPVVKIVGIRTTTEWADWLLRLARHYRTTVAGVVDRAITEWAAAEGYEEKPPQRMP